jgi:hypothetical protein
VDGEGDEDDGDEAAVGSMRTRDHPRMVIA